MTQAHSDSTSTPKKTPGHLPSLDGIRAVSILLVLLGHVGGTQGLPRLDLGVGDYAHLGVVVFFVISGFLITSLLLSEHETHGRISLKLFYARRSLRIFPASYAYVATLVVLTLLGIIHVPARHIWYAVTYMVNYLPDASWQVGHLWSLSVEEQFYLFWPGLFVVFRPKEALKIAVAVVLLGPVARIAAWFLLKGTPYYDLSLFPTVADSLATGCVLASWQGWLTDQG